MVVVGILFFKLVVLVNGDYGIEGNDIIGKWFLGFFKSVGEVVIVNILISFFEEDC